MELNKVTKKAILNMLIPAVIFLIIFDIAATVIWFVFEIKNLFNGVCTLYWLIFAFLNLVFLISPFVRYHRYRYFIDQTRIVKKEGLLFISTQFAPIERVHQITVERGPIDSLTGLAKVTAITAGGEITVRFLEKEIAEELALSLEHSVKNIVKGQAELNEK